jgi:hypothetical protein
MCRREDVRRAQDAQDAAAEALAHACKGVCTDDIGKALHKLYDSTLQEPVPEQFSHLLDRMK